MAEHAILSASAAKRWLSCSPSARLEETFPESTSDYAEEGRYGHSLAELKIRHHINPTPKKKRDAELAKARQDKWWTQDLEEAVDRYVGRVKELISEAGRDSVVLLEQRLDYSNWAPEGFGTGDCLVISGDGVCRVIDLKLGKGVPVSAVDNPQMRLYALGAYAEYDTLYDLREIHTMIVQPRLDSESTEILSISQLLDWGTDVVKPVAATAFRGEGRFQPGEHCRFCKAKAQCRARADENLSLTRHDFKEPALLTTGEIAAVLAAVDGLVSWAGDVKDYALAQALAGTELPGWKLVEGRSSRVISDPETVAATLEMEGVDGIYKEPVLRPLTELEKLVGKKRFDELVGSLIIKPPGKPVLVPEDDKRPTFDSAKNDFKE